MYCPQGLGSLVMRTLAGLGCRYDLRREPPPMGIEG